MSHSNDMRYLGPGTAVQLSPEIMGLNMKNFRTVSDSPGLDFRDCFGQSGN